MKAGGSKFKIGKKLNKKACSILDWDNKKSNPSLIRKIISATEQEKEYYLNELNIINMKRDIIAI